jgi:tetratricopeptide (TPR) repeat protein
LPEPFSAEQLNQLRQRWERDPKSRAFLQLAEEYRRAGRLADAVHVLQAGLKEHPTYLSAQVALGRCLLETGAPDAAAEILERAVIRDPTQLVANKLLVEAYLAQGQSAKARERLDLYKLFNDRDAEIEPLENRIRTLQGLPPAAPTTRKSAPRDARPEAPFDLPGGAPLADLHLDAPASPRSEIDGEPFGELHAPDASEWIAAAFARQGIFALAPAPAPIATESQPPGLFQPPEIGTPWTSGDPVALPDVLEIPAARAAEDWQEIAPEASEPAAPPPAEEHAEAVPEISGRRLAEPEAPEPEIASSFEWSAAPEPAMVPAAEPAPPTLPVSEAPNPASTTLGELYLAQGHFAEAEETFEAVLRSRPGDAAAQAGLRTVRQLRGKDAGGFEDELVEAEEPNVIVGGLTARKASLLKDYLARLRRGAKRHVS